MPQRRLKTAGQKSGANLNVVIWPRLVLGRSLSVTICVSLSLPVPEFSGILAISVCNFLWTDILVFGSFAVQIGTQCKALRVMFIEL
jgi:hypothetical protein